MAIKLLNEEGSQAFFDLTKGNWQASTAQKEKKQLARKRNHTSRWECQKVAKKAMEGLPQWKCKWCGHQFASYKSAKRHQCPLTKGASRGAGTKQDKGKAAVHPNPSKLGTSSTPTPSAPPAPSMPMATTS
jgi:hypothetical protein